VNVTGIKKLTGPNKKEDKKNEEDKGSEITTPRAGANKTKVAIEKHIEKKVVEKGGVIKKSGKDDDSDDPIA